MSKKQKEIDSHLNDLLNTRSQYWATVVYPESAPTNWISIIDDMHINVLISPLHDMDINPDNGERKKPHYHVLFLFSSLKSYKQFDMICAHFAGVGREMISSARGYARYLIHLDNPEKFQYDIKDVRSLGSISFEDVNETETDHLKIIADMEKYIVDNKVMYYCDFEIYCSNNAPTWFRHLNRCYNRIEKFINSYVKKINKSNQQRYS